MAGRSCSVCISPFRNDLEAALLTGTSRSVVSARYSLSGSALSRHVVNHTQQSLRDAMQGSTVIDSTDLLERVANVANDALRVRTVAMGMGQYSVALKSGTAELAALGILKDAGIVDLNIIDLMKQVKAVASVLAAYVVEQGSAAEPLLQLLENRGQGALADDLRTFSKTQVQSIEGSKQ